DELRAVEVDLVGGLLDGQAGCRAALAVALPAPAPVQDSAEPLRAGSSGIHDRDFELRQPLAAHLHQAELAARNDGLLPPDLEVGIGDLRRGILEEQDVAVEPPAAVLVQQRRTQIVPFLPAAAFGRGDGPRNLDAEAGEIIGAEVAVTVAEDA